MSTTRREFLRKAAAAGLSVVAARLGWAGEAQAAGRDLQKRDAGKMGWKASILAFGMAEVPPNDLDLCEKMLRRALDLGVNYIDTAPSYQRGAGERAVARVAERRKEFFLATKTLGRTKEAAAKDITESLERMKVSMIDLLHLHAINDIRTLDTVLAKGGPIEALEEAKRAEKIRYIGITGHTQPEVILEALKRYPFDAILVPVSAADYHLNDFALETIPYANTKGVSVAGMKSLKGWQNAGKKVVSSQEMLHYAFSLPIATLTCGMTTMEQVEENVRAARAFRPLTTADMDRIRAACKEWGTSQHLWWKRT
ncbi:MAG: aldo/keto reductase [Fimbriimonadia bacterium]